MIRPPRDPPWFLDPPSLSLPPTNRTPLSSRFEPLLLLPDSSVSAEKFAGVGGVSCWEMSGGVQEQFEIKFRLPDGTDIGPKRYPAASTVATLKESIVAQWPKADKEKGPRTVNDLKLINAGKILENNKTLSECKSPICDFSGMTTMHVVVRAPTSDKQSNKIVAKKPKDFKCVVPSCDSFVNSSSTMMMSDIELPFLALARVLYDA